MIIDIKKNKIRCRINYDCYAMLKQLDDKTIYLENIICEIKMRKLGLGTRLLSEIIKYFKNNKFECIIIHVHPTDNDGLNLHQLKKWYKSFGFIELNKGCMCLEF